MAKTCIAEKTARRQEWIENGLLELMLFKKYDEITVTELCAHLQLSRRSFYRYFNDLEDVLDSLLKHTFQSLVIPVGLPQIEEIRSNFEFWLDHRALFDALHNSAMIDKLFEYTLQNTDPLAIEDILAPDDLGMDICQEASLFATSGSVALALAWYRDGFRKSPAQMAQIAHRLLFHPILKSE